MKLSLIVTTYNSPSALELSLLSALSQTRLPDEIIVADDGSGSETAQLIERIGSESPIPILHSWQENKGFRAAMSRNRAIALSSGEYLVMIDGDMVLDPYFIEDHLMAACRGYFVQGGRILISSERTAKMADDKNIRLHWYSLGITNRKNALRSQWLSGLFSTSSTSLGGIKTCNFALFRDDALRVNGFDNEFIGWGREDSEFANRLLCAGIKRKNLKFSAAAYHLYHIENARATLPENDLRLQQSIDQKRIWCEDGVMKFLKGKL